MAVISHNPGGPDDAGCGPGQRGFPGCPGMIDQAIRQAVSMCWMMMPQSKATIDTVEAEIQRIVKRIFADLREDAEHFPGPR